MGVIYHDTQEKSPADVLAEESGREAVALCQERAHLFTVAEMAWLISFVQEFRWGTSAAQEQARLDDVRQLRGTVEARKQEQSP